ncbi:MAG: DUF5011 domain-containing protein, partial [Bacteroidota bacterium]|nr:DUF5011 domain-containing protein [Bacteroidota bacterium]MDX5431732.1 DUF5011 domain-containing protein [Bacteroidota bacterium]MDX5470447.1 DUF5011 domain-containing protein [Bacteroidota bacterium]
GCEYEWVITPNTYTIENGGDEFDPIVDVKFTAPGSYNVKLIVQNDNGSSFLERTNYIDVIEYCSPAVFYPTVADVGINYVKVGDMENTSASGQAPGFSDYAGTKGLDMVLGSTYSFEVSRNTNVNAVNRKIWIDFNRDGDFNDANEMVASETASSSTTFTGSFSIPGINDVVLGETKMRIGSGLVNTSLTSCGPTQVGEYEDYAVYLITDGVAPVISLVGTDVVIEVNATYTDQGASAFDNIEGDISSEIVVDNGVDLTQAGVYFVTYTVADKSGNQANPVSRKVTVVEDMTAPTVTLTGADPLLWSVLVPYVDPGFTAIDMPSGNNVDHLVSESNNVDVNAIGDYTVELEVYDAFGNKGMATRTVQVRDTTKPEVVSDPVVKVQVGAPFIDPVYATDNFDNGIQVVKVSGFVESNVVGVYTQTYTATDASGNQAANMTVSFEVGDYIAPEIQYVPGTEIVEVMVFDHNWMNNPNMSVSATDNYYGFANLEVIYPANFSIDVVGEYTITYKATDNNMNEATFERIVRVVDRERPVIVTDPLNLPRWSSYDFTMGVSVKDNYYVPADFANGTNGCRIDIIRSNVDFNYPGIYEVCYQAVDGSGNTSIMTCRTVQVGEESANTSVRDLNLENRIALYPNPSNGAFTLKIEGELSSQTSVSIFNAQGQLIQVMENPVFVGGELAIDLKGAATGVYVVRIQDGTQMVNKKVTIQ